MSCTRDFVHHKYTAIILWYIRHKWWTLSTYARNHFTHFKQINMCVFAFYGRDYMNASNRICIAYACSYYRFHPNTRPLYWSSQFSACKANDIFLHEFYEYLIFAVSKWHLTGNIIKQITSFFKRQFLYFVPYLIRNRLSKYRCLWLFLQKMRKLTTNSTTWIQMCGKLKI